MCPLSICPIHLYRIIGKQNSLSRSERCPSLHKTQHNSIVYFPLPFILCLVNPSISPHTCSIPGGRRRGGVPRIPFLFQRNRNSFLQFHWTKKHMTWLLESMPDHKFAQESSIWSARLWSALLGDAPLFCPLWISCWLERSLWHSAAAPAEWAGPVWKSYNSRRSGRNRAP